MTAYVSIVARQAPFPFNTDDANRVMFSVNFDVHLQGPSTALEKEVRKVLVDAGLVTLPNPGGGIVGDVWIGPQVTVPTGAGPYVQILGQGGFPTDETHNGGRYEHPGLQIVVRGDDYEETSTRINAIWRALDGLRNTTIVAA